MARIALAGGTSGIGLAFQNALKAQNLHDYVIFTRRRINDAKAIVVDYSSTSSLTETLRAQSIHTVISAISIADSASGQAQLNLIKACANAGCVKRFLPSEFGANYTEDFLRILPSYSYKFKAREALAKTNLEYSIVSIGMFLDYWGHPHVPSVLDPNSGTSMFIDLAHNFAAIPGDGEAIMVFTHTADAASYVIAMLDLPQWPKSALFAGDRLTLNQFVKQAEETKGVKFKVCYDRMEDLRAGKITLPPSVEKWWGSMFASIALSYLKGGFDMDMTTCKNDLFPNIKPLKVQDILNAWKGK